MTQQQSINFSSNTFLSSQAGLDFDADPDKGSPESFVGRTGTTQPLTPYALNYIRGLIQKVRDGNGAAFVKFSYEYQTNVKKLKGAYDMKKRIKQALSCLLTIALMPTFGMVPAFAKETQTTEEALKAEISELYASEPGEVGRLHKMQAFIMELALHAKTLNPDFKIIPQDAAELAFIDGDVDKGALESLISLVDGWGKEEMLFDGDGNTPNDEQKAYVELVKEGLMVTETSTVETAEKLEEYYARAEHWGIIPYPRIGGELAQELFPSKRWAENGDYFWVENPVTIGLGGRINGARNINKLTDAQNYLYNINGRPYDAWETWDAEEAAVVEEGEDGDRTRIYDSYGNGLLVPSEGGRYQPVVGEDGDPADIAKVINLYGDEWDWWWREAGLDVNDGRETWLNALGNSDYDVIYIDSFYNHRARPENQTPLTKEEIESLKYKPGGGRRQVIAYLSVGSAEQNRWYCQDDWVWVDPANPNTERSMKSGKINSGVYSPPENAPVWLALGYGGNYAEEAVVQWWHPEWRDIIINGGGKYKNVATGDSTSSIDRIINQGFDGVYLDNAGVYNRQSKRSGGWNEFETYWLNHGGIPGEAPAAPLVLQDLDYTENPVDIPNPDRGFYRANDGMVVPVSGSGSGIMNVGNSPVTVGGAQVTTRVSHVYFDLRNFSSNAFTSRGTRYNASYRAPGDVSIRSRPGDSEPFNYETHFDYWQENVLTAWPHGVSQPLTEDALAYIRDKLQQVRDGNGVALVRFNYDGAGYGWVDVDHPEDGYVDRPVADMEPDKETLLGHIAQLKPILHEYEDIIMGVDGGMFGPWGEMHSTSFGTSPEAYAWLLNAWLDAVPESRSIIVQGGAFLSWYNDTYGTSYTFEDIDQIPAPERGTPEARFGFFNDSYGYGEDEGDDYPNDWGSLSEGAGWPGDPLGDEDAYDRGRVMTWIRKQNNFYGGEAQGDATRWNTYPFVAWEASYAQTVYLNADYEKEVHERWGNFQYTEENVGVLMTNAYEEPYKTEYAIFDPVYDGRTGAEYWRDRLGYRLVLREANASEWVAQNGTLEFEGSIQNVGFGNIVNKKNVSVILKSKTDGEPYTALTDLDAREWRPDLDSRASNTDAYRDLNFSINMGAFGEVPVGDYDIYLKINDPKETSENKRCIQFANKGDDIWDADLGANLIGSTIVNPARTASGSDILVLQALNYTENPVDIPNPDRGFYRGRWQRGDTPFGTTPEVDHRIPVDASSPLYQGRQMPPVEGDDIEETQPYNGVNVNPYVGGTGVSAIPSISFMGFDLCNFSSNAFLSRQAGLDFDADPDKGSPESFMGRTGTTQPLTPYALNYIRGLLQKVRDGNGVAFVKFSYDGNGFNYVEGSDEHLIFGPEPTYVTANNPSAMCDVPGHTDKNWIEYHIWQLKPIFQEYEDVIMCVKTGMLGPWGEQHTSPEARNPVTYKKMLDAYLDAVPASRMLLTHAGGFLAWYNLTYGTSYDFSTIDTLPVPTKGSPEARFGFFNDSYAAGYDDGWTDNGSLPEGSRMFSPDWDPETGTDDDWWDITGDGYDRFKLTTWINHQNSILQGEGGIGNNIFGTFPGAILEAQQLRTTALNMRHGNYQRWNDFIYTEAAVTAPVTFPANNAEEDAPYSGETKTAFYDPVYEGKTGLEYFRDRMGYRFVLREANASEWVAQNGTLMFEGKIQNVGFGNVVNKKKVSVILKSKADSNSYAAVTTLDARDWLTAKDGNSRADNTDAYRDLNFSINMGTFGKVPLGDYDIYLKINDPKETSTNRRCIQFANYDIWDASLGANLIGSTTVKNDLFEDVREDAWYYGDVEYVHTHGLMTGTSVSQMLFGPDVPLTRGMIVTVLYRHSGSPSVSGLDNPFGDVAADSYCADAVKWAAANGAVTGWNGIFSPDDNVTRQDLAVILTCYADFAGIGLTKTREYADFADGDDIADYARDAAKRCYGAGIIGGKPGNLFDPKGDATRVEAAAMLHRLLAPWRGGTTVP